MRASVIGLLLLLVSIAAQTTANESGTQQSPANIKIDNGATTVTIWYVTDRKQVTEVQRSFQTALTRLGSSGQITSCDRVVAVSRIEQNGKIIAGRELSYGASCSMQVGSHHLSLLMCDFPMVGKFTVTWSGSNTLEWFANFIRTNCPAGG